MLKGLTNKLNVSYPLRIYSNVTHNSPIDVGYMLSLLERPRESANPSTLSLQRWPDISVKSELLIEKASDFEPKLATKYGEGMKSKRWHEISFDVHEIGQIFTPETFDEVLDGELCSGRGSHPADSKSDVERINSLLKAINRQSSNRTIQAGSNMIKDRYFPLLKDIKFGNLKEKTICTILAKTLGFESNSMPGAEAIGPKSGELSDSTKPKIDTRVDEESRPIERIMALFGADLHLLEYEHLQKLATLYGLSRNDSRSSLERALCKFFVSSMAKNDVETMVFAVLEPMTQTKAFTKTKKRTAGPESKDLGWTEEQDRLLLDKTTIVRDALQQVADKVRTYLQLHDFGSNEANCSNSEDINLWEVIAHNFPDKTAKACKKRWQILHVMHRMLEKDGGS